MSSWFRRAPSAPRASTTAPQAAADVGTRQCDGCRAALPEAARFCFICGREVESGTPAPLTGGNDAVIATLGARLAHALSGRYRIGDILGKGGMGVVFLGHDLANGRQVAIKVLRPELWSDENGIARFCREAEIAASVNHPGIIPIYEVGSEQGLNYFVMKYVDGCSLEALLKSRKAEQRPLPIAAITRILSEAAATLAHAHAHGIVHRDVKPANIMLDGESRVLLTDFGISKSAVTSDSATTAAALTEYGTVLGTPHYLAPEQALSRTVDGRADQYALGVVGFEMLTGSVPFDDETSHGIIHRHVNDLPPRVTIARPDTPPRLAAAIARALLKAPSHRFADMNEFARAIEPDAIRASRRWRRVRQLTAALILGALAAGAWKITRPPARAATVPATRPAAAPTKRPATRPAATRAGAAQPRPEPRPRSASSHR